MFRRADLLAVSVPLLEIPIFAYPLTAAPVVVAGRSLIRGAEFGIAAVRCATVVSMLAPP